MNERIEVKTQTELDAVVKSENTAICISGFFVARGSAHVVAYESAHVEAYGSAHVEARESAHVVAYESAHVEARGSAHVVAWGNVFIRLFSCFKIQAGIHVVIINHGENKKGIKGGVIINAFKPKTPLQWCAHWGVKVEKKVAILFKGVNEKYMSERGGNYTPNTTPAAFDWDGGVKECGGGLHFSPTPAMTRQFCDPKKFLACPVNLNDIAVHKDADCPEKVKAKGCCAPVWEVDENGDRV